MDTQNLNPGDIVVTTFGRYQHWSLVSDRRCAQGRPMLISATRRTGTVQEEPWYQVTEGEETYPVNCRYDEPVDQVLQRARSQIGIWDYSVARRNCEHFVKWATGLSMSSEQVDNLVVGASLGAGIGAAAQYLLNDKASTGTGALAGALLGAGLGLWMSKAEKKAPAEAETVFCLPKQAKE